jgi:hypothetical protein
MDFWNKINWTELLKNIQNFENDMKYMDFSKIKYIIKNAAS